MSEKPLDPAVLGRVLAEVKSIQAMAPEGMPVWFKADAIVDASGIDRKTVNEALLKLCARQEVISALTIEDGIGRLVYALAEAVENNESSSEKA